MTNTAIAKPYFGTVLLGQQFSINGQVCTVQGILEGNEVGFVRVIVHDEVDRLGVSNGSAANCLRPSSRGYVAASRFLQLAVPLPQNSEYGLAGQRLLARNLWLGRTVARAEAPLSEINFDAKGRLLLKAGKQHFTSPCDILKKDWQLTRFLTDLKL